VVVIDCINAQTTDFKRWRNKLFESEQKKKKKKTRRHFISTLHFASGSEVS